MKESINELQSVIRQVRPHILQQHYSAQRRDRGEIVEKSNESEVVARNELRLEAVSELIGALATFVWKLDCLWDDQSQSNEEQIGQNNVQARNDAANNSISKHDEPKTEWNEDAKASIREGYGMIIAVSQPPSSIDKAIGDVNDDMDDIDHKEMLRMLARSSLLELLTSLSTSSCRHFILAFLPHFTPLELSSNYDLNEDKQSTIGVNKKFQLEQRNEQAHHSAKDKCIIPEVISQLLDAFQSLIQIDATTLVPFLSILSNLLGNTPCDENDNNDRHEAEMSDNNDTDHHCRNNPREQCFRICISSMTSVAEDDLPSLLKSLFLLVRSEEEGSLAMKTIRKECNAAFGVSATTIPDPSILSLGPKDDGDLSINGHNNINHLVLFVGNVIIQSLLSEELRSSKHLSRGFLEEIRRSLSQPQTQNYTTQISSNSDSNKPSSNCMSTLDAIILIALYSHGEYQSLVESVIDSLTTHQTVLFFALIHPLIESWKPTKRDIHHTSSLLYGPLSSSLISLLFYTLIVSATSEQYGGSRTLVNGLLSVHYCTVTEKVTGANATEECNVSLMISNLYSNIDTQKQQQIVSSLLSMVTDSFIQNSATSTSDLDFRTNGKKISTSEGYNEKERIRTSFLLSASYAACRTILLISAKFATNLFEIKGIVMDRLLLLASTPGLSTQEKLAKTDDITLLYHLFDMNSAIIISLLQENRFNGSVDETSTEANELLILCQKFLFATDYLSHGVTNNNSQHRVTCGIILASRLLRCKCILRSERANIWNWVISVISPTSSTLAPLKTLNPVVAKWGLSFLHFASSPIASNSCHPEINELVDANPVCGQSDVFDQVNKMLATAAVIQMESSLLIPQRDKSSNENITFLAYSHFPQKKKASDATGRMVISSPYFLYGNGAADKEGPKPSLHAIDQVASYMYDLVDRYLELGRKRSAGGQVRGTKSSWNPRGWLLTKIQFPCCLSQSTIELLGMKNNHRLELEDEPSGKGDLTPESWKLLFTSEVSKASLVRKLIEFLNCTIVSISISSAVLKHAHHHFLLEEVHSNELNDYSEDSKKKKKKQKQVENLRKLLQFQVNKLLSMKRICRNLYQLLNGLYLAAFRGIYNPDKTLSSHKNNIISDRRRIPLTEIKVSVKAAEIFLRALKFDSITLWSYLSDDADDAFLLETMKMADIAEQILSRKQQQIIYFRIQVLRQLQHNLSSNNKQNKLGGESLRYNPPELTDDRSQAGISRVFQSLMSLTPFLSTNVTSKCTNQDYQMYLPALYKILLAAFSLVASNSTGGPSILESTFIDLVSNQRRRKKAVKIDSHDRHSDFDQLILMCAGTKDTVDRNTIPAVRDATTAKLKGSLMHQLEKCEDASISCYIVDLLSILAIKKNSSRGAMADITWKNIHFRHNFSSSSITHPPYMLIETNRVISEVTKKDNCDRKRVAVVKDALSHLLRLTRTLLKTKDLHTKTFYHNILVHYSSLLIDNVSQSHWLEEMYTALEATAAKFSISSKTLPGLNKSTAPSVFELLLQMNALSLSLAKPVSNKKYRPLNADKNQGTYSEIIWPIKMFSKLLTFLGKYSFSQVVLSRVVKHSLSMIKLCDYQLQHCIDWRNSQNAPQFATGSQDYAAANMLQPLIDCIASVCIGSITSFCHTIKKELSDSNYNNTKSIAVLIFRIQGIKDTLQDACQAQHLYMPKDFSRPDTVPVASKRKDVADNSSSEKKRHRAVSSSKSKKKVRLSAHSSVLTQLANQAEIEYKTRPSPEPDDTSMSDNTSLAASDDDSFGVVGDWAM